MPDKDEDIKRYLARAAELRELAAQVRDPEARDSLLKAAEAYERLAESNANRKAGTTESP